MSHELRTPLNAISGFSQVLRKQLFGEINDKQAEYLDDILGSSRHLLSLIDDVLDLSKVEAGQIDLQVAPFSLPEALERGVVIVRERATREGVRVSLSSEPGVETVVGDERRIVQVIFNLLSNAVKFTPAGGTVDVAATGATARCACRSRDTGPGIAPEDQDRIFEEFQQADAGKEQSEGTGLGLALSKRLIELHGGRIWVDSELGQGQHLRVHPARRDPHSHGTASRSSWSRTTTKNMKLFRDVLQATGYRTLEASTGGQALALASEHRPGARADGHPAARHGRPRGPGPAADGRTHRGDPGPRRDRPGDARGPRAVHGGGFRRLSRRSRSTSTNSSRSSGSTAREATGDARRMLPGSSSSTTCRRTSACWRRCSRPAATTVLSAGDGASALELDRVRRRPISSCSTS